MGELSIEYDSLCYHTYVKIALASQDTEEIAFKGFNYNNKEHQFVIALTMACIGILGNKDVAIDGSNIARFLLRRRYNKVCDFKRLTKNHENVIDINELLNSLRPMAIERCGSEFDFGIIYENYYEERK